MTGIRITALVLIALAMSTASGHGRATALTVVTDTPVTQSLVAMVMDGAAGPTVLLPEGASPHNYALRPSDAKLLQSSDLVVWTSSMLTPWLDRAIQALSDETQSLELMSVQGTSVLQVRLDEDFRYWLDAKHVQMRDDIKQPPVDPHGWLDPHNARTWLSAIAAMLVQLDPENEQRYVNNTRLAEARLVKLQDDITRQLGKLEKRPFIVFHDSYQYFESRFKLNAIGAVSLSDASQPGIRHIRQLRRLLEDQSDACVFKEPQYSSKLVETVSRGLSVRQGTLDPLGASLDPGPDLYVQLIQAMSDEFKHCFDS